MYIFHSKSKLSYYVKVLTLIDDPQFILPLNNIIKCNMTSKGHFREREINGSLKMSDFHKVRLMQIFRTSNVDVRINHSINQTFKNFSKLIIHNQILITDNEDIFNGRIYSCYANKIVK